METVSGEDLLELLDRLFPEVRDPSTELELRLRDEVADRLDAAPLQAVVDTTAELKFLDGKVEELVSPAEVENLVHCHLFKETGDLFGIPINADFDFHLFTSLLS